eukprot:1147543-Pelagomonas_calceolata.AAC.1
MGVGRGVCEGEGSANRSKFPRQQQCKAYDCLVELAGQFLDLQATFGCLTGRDRTYRTRGKLWGCKMCAGARCRQGAHPPFFCFSLRLVCGGKPCEYCELVAPKKCVLFCFSGWAGWCQSWCTAGARVDQGTGFTMFPRPMTARLSKVQIQRQHEQLPVGRPG